MGLIYQNRRALLASNALMISAHCGHSGQSGEYPGENLTGLLHPPNMMDSVRMVSHGSRLSTACLRGRKRPGSQIGTIGIVRAGSSSSIVFTASLDLAGSRAMRR